MHGEFLESFNCPTCGKKFSTEYLLKYHYEKEHKQILTKDELKKCSQKQKNTKQGKYSKIQSTTMHQILTTRSENSIFDIMKIEIYHLNWLFFQKKL